MVLIHTLTLVITLIAPTEVQWVTEQTSSGPLGKAVWLSLHKING